ncbi:MAG TPA: hypothetical protein EYP85_03130 [Armatimonadetes bacterium]|nr:hypothetical protein [Armatimonadota bacterium]
MWPLRASLSPGPAGCGDPAPYPSGPGVRRGGYSAYFTLLAKNLPDEIIARTEVEIQGKRWCAGLFSTLNVSPSTMGRAFARPFF